jgi:iron-sulfur cluster repair protein YtfE (RIC family)
VVLDVIATPDDGSRRSTEQVWDESARPTGPGVDPGFDYSRQGTSVAGHLVEVHDHLRAELERVHDLVDQVRGGRMAADQARAAVNDLTLRQNDWTLGAYCASFCTFVAGHHGLEDQAVFPYLKGSDERLAPVIDRLAAEHHVVHELLVRLDTALVDVLREPDDLSGLADALDVLTDALLSHLSYEERELLEPLARLGFYPGQV